jgi:HPt (histidine-containing phosphotransfer) domain-containing protein
MPLSALLNNTAAHADLATSCPELKGTFDLDALLDRCMADAGLATKLLERFGARLPKSVAEIKRLLTSQDRTEVLKQVHTMKGESGSLSAVGLQQAAGDLETQLREASDLNDPEIARLAAELAAAANLCQERLPQALAALAAAAENV